jgi:ribosome-binding protein aMBF1 (putative translation factor)
MPKPAKNPVRERKESELRATYQLMLQQALVKSNLDYRALAEELNMPVSSVHALFNSPTSTMSLLQVVPLMELLGII